MAIKAQNDSTFKPVKCIYAFGEDRTIVTKTWPSKGTRSKNLNLLKHLNFMAQFSIQVS